MRRIKLNCLTDKTSYLLKINNMESKKYSLNKEDLKKILIGACIALGGSFLTYLSAILTQIDMGIYTPVVVAIFSILINTGKKFIEGIK